MFFRRRFLASVTDIGTLTIDCDNEYRAFLNGELVGTDDSMASPEALDLTGRFVAGENVLALEGIDHGGPGRLACRAAGSFGEFVSDSSFKVSDDDFQRDDLNGSAWKVISVPGLDRRAQATILWNELQSIPASAHPDLHGLRRADIVLPVTYAREGEILVQLRAATHSGGHHLVTAGTYRLILDLVE